MPFLFNILKAEGLYVFRALLAHPQEALHKWPNGAWYTVCVLCQLAAPGFVCNTKPGGAH
jgi:hypothetical protein